MAGIIVITVGGIAEIDNSALLCAPINVANSDALITELITVHTASAINSDEAVREVLSLTIPT